MAVVCVFLVAPDVKQIHPLHGVVINVVLECLIKGPHIYHSW